MRGPPLSPWQVSVSLDQAHSLIVELEVNKFESEKILKRDSLKVRKFEIGKV